MSSNGLTKEDMQDIIEAVMNRGRTIDNETHAAHHKYIEMELERHKNKKAMWMKFKMSMVGTIATAIVGWTVWVGTQIWDVFHSSGGNHP